VITMPTAPIETEEEYDLALERLVRLIDAPKGSTEAMELEDLLQAIEEYEDLAHPLDGL
jgi:HTH-type transcriptional regulator / antitoxin HigA